MKNSDQSFSDEFRSVIDRFIESLEAVIQSYDYVVLVARKAVCLYYALRLNGYCRHASSRTRIVSSRALEFGFMGRLEGSSVAIVDDVVLTGKSMEDAVDDVRRLGGVPDIYVAALSANYSTRALEGLYLQAARRLRSKDAFRLSREVVGYIQAAGVTLNIDQPVFKIQLDTPPALTPPLWLDVTTPSQREADLAGATILFDANGALGDIPGSHGAVLKARAQYSIPDRKLSIIPFVLLGPVGGRGARRLLSATVGTELIRELSKSSGRGDKRFLRCSIRLARYALSIQLGKAVMETMGWGNCEYPDLESEMMLFGRTVSGDFLFEALPGIVSGDQVVVCNERDSAMLGTAMGAMMGKLVTARAGTLSGDILSDRELADPSAVTLNELISSVRDAVGGERDALLASASLDLLVDGGLLVPCLRRGRIDGKVQRAYKGGEVFRLKERDYILLRNSLNCFIEGVKDEDHEFKLNKDVAVRLAILFLCELGVGRKDLVLICSSDTSDSQYDFDSERMAGRNQVTRESFVDILISRYGTLTEDRYVSFPKLENKPYPGRESYQKDALAGKYVDLYCALAKKKSGQSEEAFRGILDKLVVSRSALFRLRYLSPALSRLKFALMAAIIDGPANYKHIREFAADVTDRLAFPHTDQQMAQQLEWTGLSRGRIGDLTVRRTIDSAEVDVKFAAYATEQLGLLAKRAVEVVDTLGSGVPSASISQLKVCYWAVCALQRAFERFFEPGQRYDWGFLRVLRYRRGSLDVPARMVSWDGEFGRLLQRDLGAVLEDSVPGDLVVCMADELSGALFMPPSEGIAIDNPLDYVYSEEIRNVLKRLLEEFRPDWNGVTLWVCSPSKEAVLREEIKSLLSEAGISKKDYRGSFGRAAFEVWSYDALFVSSCLLACEDSDGAR